ncbi:hypothetical protein LX32DRAFT_84278 [Colletotrichum zoysiae]|uniref:Secreted protein n=1 Tax=Colletotrichum zoysiae TaxID=1216348 RepID=A0AAD9HAF6_9PEZI|nr:hypothetical protein LX32DRAFT_84278 [Colletotrichum zoysiae]
MEKKRHARAKLGFVFLLAWSRSAVQFPLKLDLALAMMDLRAAGKTSLICNTVVDLHGRRDGFCLIESFLDWDGIWDFFLSFCSDCNLQPYLDRTGGAAHLLHHVHTARYYCRVVQFSFLAGRLRSAGYTPSFPCHWLRGRREPEK